MYPGRHGGITVITTGAHCAAKGVINAGLYLDRRATRGGVAGLS
jgi:hypothetical protein